MRGEGNCMDNGYKVAEFSNHQDMLLKINEYEKDLKKSAGQDIVLIAYTKKQSS